MKLLLISDQIHEALYTYFQKERWQDVDLILSAGDLKASYLSFLVTLIEGAPLYYVRGNHDIYYEKEPPLGCIDIHAKIMDYQGLTILGLEGSRWYNGEGIQYREWGMKWNVLKLLPKILFKEKIDIILTHAPPFGLHDGKHIAHKGFKVYNYLLDKLQPRYFIHGHVHLSYERQQRIIKYKNTKIINAFQYHVLEI